MTHPTDDPRARLATYGQSPTAQAFAGAEYARFYDTAPQEITATHRIWYARGQHFVLAYAQAEPGPLLARPEQPDEYVVLQPDADSTVEITWNGTTTAVSGNAIAFVPAGSSSLHVTRPGRVVVLFTAAAADLCLRCSNQAAYAEAHPHIPPFAAWPSPPPRVRHYSLDVPDEPGRFGRIWRCSTFMVNVLPAQIGPRDVTQLSPHHHDDFEQGSLALEGAFTHHLRWPWTRNMLHWREDEHTWCAAPSLAVIPPKATHTSRGMLDGVNQLVDIFSPPRQDFSRQPGWVLNTDDYPLPEPESS